MYEIKVSQSLAKINIYYLHQKCEIPTFFEIQEHAH